MLFLKSKTLSHRETASVGFVLALLSCLFTGVFSSFFIWFISWMGDQSIYAMDLFLGASFFTIYLAVQGLLLFGFPLYYVQDKKSHMTGFQILIYALMFSFALILASALIMVFLTSN